MDCAWAYIQNHKAHPFFFPSQFPLTNSIAKAAEPNQPKSGPMKRPPNIRSKYPYPRHILPSPSTLSSSSQTVDVSAKSAMALARCRAPRASVRHGAFRKDTPLRRELQAATTLAGIKSLPSAAHLQALSLQPDLPAPTLLRAARMRQEGQDPRVVTIWVKVEIGDELHSSTPIEFQFPLNCGYVQDLIETVTSKLGVGKPKRMLTLFKDQTRLNFAQMVDAQLISGCEARKPLYLRSETGRHAASDAEKLVIEKVDSNSEQTAQIESEGKGGNAGADNVNYESEVIVIE